MSNIKIYFLCFFVCAINCIPFSLFAEESNVALKWFEKIKFFGDLKTRNQITWFDQGNDTETDTIQRFALHFASEVDLTDHWKVGARFISGDAFTLGTDNTNGNAVSVGNNSARAGNQTMTNSFGTKMFNLDWAYAKWDPCRWFSTTVGKFKNPFYAVEDMLWDTDISFEGAVGGFKYFIESDDFTHIEFFVLSGAFPLERAGVFPIRAANVDALLAVVQGGFRINFSDDIWWKAAAGYYDFAHVQNKDLSDTQRTNTEVTPGLASHGNGLAYDYEPIDIASEFGFLIPWINTPSAILGNFVHNTDSPNNDIGFLAGLRIGDPKVSKQWQWSAVGTFRRLERDAWLDDFPDADFHYGQTSVEGWEVRGDLALWDNILLTVDGYIARRIGADLTGQQGADRVDRMQVDITWVF